jgi:hypothetical protein
MKSARQSEPEKNSFLRFKTLRLDSFLNWKILCYDNASMESFWGLLKNELVHHRRFKNRAEAIHTPSPATSKYFTGGNANRHVCDISLLSHLSANSMKIGWRHEPVGVHY